MIDGERGAATLLKALSIFILIKEKNIIKKKNWLVSYFYNNQVEVIYLSLCVYMSLSPSFF